MKFVIITLHQSCMYMMYMYFSPLRHPTHLHGRPGWTAGYMGGWSVGVSNFHRYSGVPIHSRGRRASQAVGSANCVISVITSRSVVWADYRKTMSTHAAVALFCLKMIQKWPTVLLRKMESGIADCGIVYQWRADYHNRLQVLTPPVPRTRLSTYGDRAFPVATARVGNSLPQHVTPASTLSTFCIRLKTHCYNFCYP